MLFHSVCLSVMTLILFVLMIVQTARVACLEKRIRQLEEDKLKEENKDGQTSSRYGRRDSWSFIRIE